MCVCVCVLSHCPHFSDTEQVLDSHTVILKIILQEPIRDQKMKKGKTGESV